MPTDLLRMIAEHYGLDHLLGENKGEAFARDLDTIIPMVGQIRHTLSQPDAPPQTINLTFHTASPSPYAPVELSPITLAAPGS